MYYSSADLEQLDQRFRTSFINSLAGYKPANLIGTKSINGESNVAVFNSVMHIGANPALMAFIMRPTSVERHTYNNIIHSKSFTINNVTQEIYKSAHQTSARYEKNQSEFLHCGLTEQYIDSFHAPYVAESTLKIGLKLEHDYEIPLNNTRLIIGSVQHVYLPDNSVLKDGTINHEQLNTITVNGLYAYYNASFIEQLAYAKP